LLGAIIDPIQLGAHRFPDRFRFRLPQVQAFFL
jgi:hypothetical protein